MPRPHTIAQGETLAELAAEHGFSRGAQLYEHTDNAALREGRSGPDVLAAGEVVLIPDPVPGVAGVRVSARHRFQITRPRQHLRIQPLDSHGETFDGSDYVLEVEGVRFEGTIDGCIEHRIPLGTRRARLEVRTSIESQPSIIWDLEVGHLEPVDTPAGLQARLNNLGFSPGAIDAELGPKTEAGLRRFQEAHGLDVDGSCTPEALDKLLEEHGC